VDPPPVAGRQVTAAHFGYAACVRAAGHVRG
jgi:hypothetical protein